MITDSYDPNSTPVITPEAVYGAREKLCDTVIVTFSHEICESILESHACREIAAIRACNGRTPIYALAHNGKELAFYLSPIGATNAANFVIEANHLTGADKFVMFGSAGCLDREATRGKLVVPTAAYRDEGMSYHYAPPADYIDVPGAAHVAETFRALGVPYVEGRVWTTDAPYRETRAQVDARRAEGCLAVEMELAGVQAVCSFHGFGLYDFLMTGDVLDLPEWDVAELHAANHCLSNFRLALKLAESL